MNLRRLEHRRIFSLQNVGAWRSVTVYKMTIITPGRHCTALHHIRRLTFKFYELSIYSGPRPGRQSSYELVAGNQQT